MQYSIEDQPNVYKSHEIPNVKTKVNLLSFINKDDSLGFNKVHQEYPVIYLFPPCVSS